MRQQGAKEKLLRWTHAQRAAVKTSRAESREQGGKAKEPSSFATRFRFFREIVPAEPAALQTVLPKIQKYLFNEKEKRSTGFDSSYHKTAKPQGLSSSGKNIEFIS